MPFNIVPIGWTLFSSRGCKGIWLAVAWLGLVGLTVAATGSVRPFPFSGEITPALLVPALVSLIHALRTRVSTLRTAAPCQGVEPVAPRLPDAGTPEATASNSELVADELRAYCGVVAILQRQLANATSETQAAALSFMEQLTALDALVRDFLAEHHKAERDSAAIAKSGHCEVVQMRTAVLDMRTWVAGRAVEMQSDRALYARIVGETEEFAAAISGIAANTKLLALNAAIESAHAGDAGRGFSIIAKEIRSLADDAAGSASNVAARLRRLRRDTDRQLSGADGAEQEEALLQSAERQVAEAERAFDQLATQGRRMLDTAQTSGTAVAAAVIESMSTVQFQDIVRQKLEHVIDDLARVGAHADRLADALTDGQDVPHVESELIHPMQEAYVMQSEHDALDGRIGLRPAGKAVDLF